MKIARQTIGDVVVDALDMLAISNELMIHIDFSKMSGQCCVEVTGHRWHEGNCYPVCDDVCQKL
eukprot:11663382-Ditylum_brightwellii.AAC.1